MTERPIIFSAPMINAIIAGRKTQTRRLVTAEMSYIGGRGEDPNDPSLWGFADQWGSWHLLDQSQPPFYSCSHGANGETFRIQCPYGSVGDRLWVKEAWVTAASLDDLSPSDIAKRCGDAGYERAWCPIEFVADGFGYNWDGAWRPHGRVRSPLHMPRWASRITLEITGVRVERLAQITEADAIAEGVPSRFLGEFDEGQESGGVVSPDGHARSNFFALWDKINGKRNHYAPNPWLWVVEFRRAT